MADHPRSEDLAAYREGRLTAAETVRIDAHLDGCSACADLLARQADAAADRRVLRAVKAADPHLSYEQLEAVVDGRGRREPEAEAHLASCGRCRADLQEMRSYAAALSAPLLAPRQAEAPSLLSRLFGSAGWRAIGVAAAVVIAIAVLYRGEPQSNGWSGSAAAHLDRSALQELDKVSAEAGAAYRAGDYQTLATLLKARAQQGDANAQDALALLYAEGKGVPQDLGEARKLWQEAAGNGDEEAKRNLLLLDRR